MDEAASRRGGRAALIVGATLIVLCAGAGVLTGVAHQLTLGTPSIWTRSATTWPGVAQQTLEPAHVSVWIGRRGPGVS